MSAGGVGLALTHYAVVLFGGDPASEHPDQELRGNSPTMTLIACGPEEFCWAGIEKWTAAHPLRMWETVEVLARDPSTVRPAPVGGTQ